MSNSQDSAATGETQIGGFDTGARALVFSACAAIGIGLGFVVPVLAGWAASLPWMPFQGPLQLIGSFDQGWLVWGRPLIGALLGLAFAGYIVSQSAVLTLADSLITVRTGKNVTTIQREKVDGVRHSGGKVTIVNSSGRELFAGDVEGDRDAIAAAFKKHGYPWESR